MACSMAAAAFGVAVGSSSRLSCAATTSSRSISVPSYSGLNRSQCFGTARHNGWDSVRGVVGGARQSGITMAAVLDVVDVDGKPVGVDTLDLKVARPETAKAVVHRGLITELQNRRHGNASTKTRAEVRGGGRKPFAQKGGGRARRGSQRTPLRPGGGVIFGPKPKDWKIKINKKEKRLSISTALQSAARDTVVVDGLETGFAEPKTAAAKSALESWGIDPYRDYVTILLTEVADAFDKSFRNLSHVKVVTPDRINLYDILRADKLVVSKGMLAHLNARYSPLSEAGDFGEEEDEEGEEEEEEEVGAEVEEQQ